jgi:hypothetical protein
LEEKILDLLEWKNRIYEFVSDCDEKYSGSDQYGETSYEYYCCYSNYRASLTKEEEKLLKDYGISPWLSFHIRYNGDKIKRWFFVLQNKNDLTFILIDFSDPSHISALECYRDIEDTPCSFSEFKNMSEKHEKLVNWIFSHFIDRAKNRMDFLFA